MYTYIHTNAIVNFNSHNLYIITFSAPFLFFNSWMLAIGHGVEMRCHPLDGHNASNDATIHNVMTTSQFLMFPPPLIVIYGRVGG